MKITEQNTDLAILAELAERLSATRLRENLTQAELAAQAGVSKRTIERMEKGESVQLTNFIRVLRALDLAGKLDSLVPEPGLSPIAQLESKGRERRRASSSRKREEDSGETWTWGE